MKKSTKLRRDRKRQLKKARRVAIDFETELPVKGLMGPRYQLHFAMLDDAVGFKPGELAMFPREYLGYHHPSTMDVARGGLVELKTDGVVQDVDRRGYALVTFTSPYMFASWVNHKCEPGMATTRECDDICAVSLYGLPEEVVRGEPYLLRFESSIRHRMFATGSTFKWRVGGTPIKAICLVVKDSPPWIDIDTLIRKKQLHESADRELTLSEATQVNTSPLPTISKEELALLEAADTLCDLDRYDDGSKHDVDVAAYRIAEANFMATRKEF